STMVAACSKRPWKSSNNCGKRPNKRRKTIEHRSAGSTQMQRPGRTARMCLVAKGSVELLRCRSCAAANVRGGGENRRASGGRFSPRRAGGICLFSTRGSWERLVSAFAYVGGPGRLPQQRVGAAAQTFPA